MSCAVGGRQEVNTEFIYGEVGSNAKVFLCGDWNDWTPVSMEYQGVWSKIVKIPSGYHEYCFVVNGQPVVSSAHPVASSRTVNWRTIAAPKTHLKRIMMARNTNRQSASLLYRLQTRLQRMAEAFRRLFVSHIDDTELGLGPVEMVRLLDSRKFAEYKSLAFSVICFIIFCGVYSSIYFSLFGRYHHE
mmetsp:Transcript_464/g.838  ORF Transcript_464/g.838 Transcript_464/m.838 type:complete len:188 (-) Transcript_464:399-962(-)